MQPLGLGLTRLALLLLLVSFINGFDSTKASPSPSPPQSPKSPTANVVPSHQHPPSPVAVGAAAAARHPVDHNLFKDLPDLTTHLLPEYLRNPIPATSPFSPRLPRSGNPLHVTTSSHASHPTDKDAGATSGQHDVFGHLWSGKGSSSSEPLAKWGFTRDGIPKKKPGVRLGTFKGKVQVFPDAPWGRKKNGEPRKKPGALSGSLTLTGVPKRDGALIRKAKGYKPVAAGTGLSRARGDERTEKQKQGDMKRRKSSQI